MKELHFLVVLVVIVFLVAMLVLLPGCGKETAERKTTVQAGTPPIPAVPRDLDSALVARGAKIYRAHCAECHGANAEGAPNWHAKGADGKYPAPPLNGTGHAWHHPASALKWTIREGTAKLGGNMPPWKDTLPDRDIEAVIAWFQSLWPEEVYKNWVVMDGRARQDRSTR